MEVIFIIYVYIYEFLTYIRNLFDKQDHHTDLKNENV